MPATLEACVMRVSDIIAYLGKDRQDAMKIGLFSTEPSYQRSKIGTHNAEIINNMIVNIVENSYGESYLKMDEDFFEAFSVGKKENYELIYRDDKVKEVYATSIHPMMEQIYGKLLDDVKSRNKDSILYKHHIAYVKGITKYYSTVDYEENDPNDIVVDFIASMTDDYFVDLYDYLFPKGKSSVKYVGYFE